MYEMNKDLYIGNTQIDEEHTRLFELAEQTHQILQLPPDVSDKFEKVKGILEELRAYTHYHFGHEEEYMTGIHYKRLATQKIQHKVFLKMLDEWDLDSLIEQKKDKTVEDLLKLYTDWLKYHIIDNDMLITSGD